MAKLNVKEGPFWGPNFKQIYKPEFSFEQAGICERRIVEQREKKMKTIYQIGGAGAVGLQSIAGMYHLYQLLKECKNKNVPISCWPFNGWALPTQGHVLVEIYPLLMNSGTKSDENDARETVLTVAELDEREMSEGYLSPQMNEEESILRS